MPEKIKKLLGAEYREIVTTIFLIIMMLVFPLYYHHYYYDILQAKYKFYWMASLIFLILMLFGAVFEFAKEQQGIKDLVSVKKLRELPLTNKLLIGFLAFSTISTLVSEFLYESFWGNEGRYSGLFLMLIYGIVTLVVASKAEDKHFVLDIFLFSGLLICLFGITDYFRMDLFGWKVGARDKDVDVFYSTLGNANTYTAYIGMLCAVEGSLLCTGKDKKRNICYFILLVISFVAIITGQSDNAYLSLGALFAVIPFFIFGKLEGVMRYSFMVSGMFTAIKIVDFISVKYKGKVIGIYGLFNKIAGFKYLEVVVLVSWVVSLALLALCLSLKKKDREVVFGKKLVCLWGAFVALCFAGLVAALVDANMLGHGDRYGALKSYLVFTDEWGTMRGFAWKSAMKSYLDMDFIHKLFGHGPDTFGILTWNFRHIASDKYGFYFESAHNEYLQFLVTVGPFALACYIGFLISACVEMGRKVKEKPWLLAALTAVICYSAQAVVNINLPIATPVFWTILALGLAGARTVDREKESN